MWNPFKRKSYADIANPVNNTLLHALYQYVINNGIATVMQDDPTSYLRDGYQNNDDVFSIINRIIRMSGQARLTLYKIENKRWIEVPDHELTKFTRSVNPIMKTSDFIQGHLIYKLAIGNSYWYKPTLEAGMNKGKTKELWLMPANAVEVVGGPSWMNPVGGYILNTNQSQKFTPEEVYHSKYFNPLFANQDYLYGQSPLKAATYTISKQNESANTELKQFQNQSPPYIIYRDTQDIAGGWTDQQRLQLEDVLKKHAEGDKRGSILALHEKVGLLNIGVSPVDLNILNSSLEGRRKLCNIYGFPSVLMNDTAQSTYNNIMEARKSAWSDCIIPNLKELAADLTAFLIDPVEEYVKQGLFFEWDYSEVQELQADRASMVTWMRQAWWTPNQILEATGQIPIDKPEMNEPWVGMGEMPLSQATSDITVEPLLKHYGDYTKKN